MSSYLVDPDNITVYGRSVRQLELVLLFWIAAAGKNAKASARALDALMRRGRARYGVEGPFRIVLAYGDSLPEAMRRCGMGCYNNKSRSMRALALSGLDLRECGVLELEAVPGIGPKTARCFLMHSRRDVRHAGLDTHVLKYLRDMGFDVPRSTPTGRRYAEIEKIFLDMADEAGLSPADLDLQIWRKYSGDRRRKTARPVGR